METVLRTVGLLAFGFICYRLMGYRSMGDMEPTDFVIMLVIAETLGTPLADESLSLTNTIIAVSTLTILQILFSWTGLKSTFLLQLMDGKPIPVIQNGKILEKNMRKARVNRSDLMEELRVQGLSNYLDVEFAYLEPSGRFSIIRKKEVEPITPRYLGKKTSKTIMENGEIFADQLTQSGVTAAELAEILESFHIDDLNQLESIVVTPDGHIALTKKQQ
ncbi:DUF421 domain-containing protein [Dehalobacterium formicoaceticum]|uniref:DUF421 domain-containing protein n=1 Tax=Dehalobacterium formicoaceticum TaxID=51515 RepID=A0ABT1Y363_9FIRM|nr:DUF421 domain-containing protein [Dehalobacterium formicoaceticum]MCR6545315.1 DUF421 domain-containing protein [Dehalobacterium formicoaceticum]